MGDVWRQPPVHLEERVRAPAEPPARELRDTFFADVRRLSLGLVRGERWRLRLGPLTLLSFGEPAFDGWAWSWPITGGLLAGGPGGTLRYGWRDGELVGAVDGYRPRLPAPVYRATQLPAHRLLTRWFLLRLRGRLPPPGAPAGPVQRLLAAGLDLGLCAGVTTALRPRRRLRVLAGVAIGYHLACWSLGGRTAGALATGQRLVSVDGRRPAPWQAALRLAALPLAVGTLRAAHDEAAATEVVEA
jgi:RDD family